jgi:DNA (cytosine-5)-methyltransferase 1
MELFPRKEGPRNGPSCVDVFAGAGGFGAGFRSAGWSILAANDRDGNAGATFRENFPETAFFQGPVAALNARSLLAECGLRAGELDCLIGGPPCQSFSFNNHNRSATDERAQLFLYYLNLVKDLNPKTIVMENVPGVLTIDGGNVFGKILRGLRSLGFHTHFGILSAEQFGTPQMRKRVFIVASRLGPASELIPGPTHWSPRFARRRKSGTRRPEGATRRVVTVWQAIGDLPRLENGGGEHRARWPGSRPTTVYQRQARDRARFLHNHRCRTLEPVNLNRIRHVPEGGNWRDIPFELLPAGMQRARPMDHTKRYGRLARKGIASTVLTKCDPHWGAYVHPTQDRVISVREAARLQGFPDSFQFAGTNLCAHYVQVGNAVPVPVAWAIADAVLKHIDRHGQISLQISEYGQNHFRHAA